MQEYEKLGSFYLGREYDLARKQRGEALVLYDSKDLVTHAVCVGMTGSGKTGLCISLLEEAAIDGIPALVVDPKGDLADLMLTFPELRPEDFRPWIDEDEARRKNLAPEDFARQQAELWKRGLAEWDQDGERIRRLRAAADFAVYTPGSRAGIPVSILRSFAAPAPGVRDDADLLRERVQNTATSLLGLLGIEADPIRSREHILVSTILNGAWNQGQDLDLAQIIHGIQAPPVERVGVLDLESFYPAKERFELGMALNNLLAAPGFAAWLEGEPLDIGQILYTAEGKPRHAIFSIAHLSDAERMFFVSLLLNQTLGWMRAQTGTTSLRAVLYMDEIFGYFPPTANPPSKAPLLALMKQARAFGLGVVLATQNPVDLDYKGLANAGTWFIGRLQTERDKGRLLDGLEGAGVGGTFDRAATEQMLAALGNRVFLLHDVHEDAPRVFETRWAMSYLRGPLTREQIKKLMSERVQAAAPSASATPATPGSAATGGTGGRAGGAGGASGAPLLPPDVPQYFVPARGAGPVVYAPMLLGAAGVWFSDPKADVEFERKLCLLASIPETPGAETWREAREAEFGLAALEKSPAPDAQFRPLASEAATAKAYERWKRELGDWLARNQTLELLQSPLLKETSRPGESERDFRIRLLDKARERRDAQKEALGAKYAPKMERLQEQIRRAQQAQEREAEQLRQQKMQTAVSFGATLLGAFLGGGRTRRSSLGRATTAARGLGRTQKEAGDVARAGENVEVLQQRLQDLNAEFASEAGALDGTLDMQSEVLQKIALRPKKTAVTVSLVALAWNPE